MKKETLQDIDDELMKDPYWSETSKKLIRRLIIRALVVAGREQIEVKDDRRDN